MTNTETYPIFEKKLDNFNKDYLNHNFILYDDQDWIGLNIYCEKCNIKCRYYSFNKTYLIRFNVARISPKNRILILTCEEMIIKNIIE